MSTFINLDIPNENRMKRVCITIFLFWTLSASAQTQFWSSLGTGLNFYCNDLLVLGQDLYASGSFTVAGQVPCKRIAKWDGANWSNVGNGFNATVTCMEIFNNELYAAGYFDSSGSQSCMGVAKWDGNTWSQVGNGIDGYVEDMCAFNGELYVTGTFDSIGVTRVNNIAKWDGTNWTPLGTGLTYGSSFNNSYGICLEVWNNQLVVGGFFDSIAGYHVNNIATWDGAIFNNLNLGLNGPVYCVKPYNNLLYAGGGFTSSYWATSLLSKIAVWNGTSWANVGNGLNGAVFSIYGHGSNLYIGGSFTSNSTAPGYLAVWNGSNFDSIGKPNNWVRKILASEDVLYVAGCFFQIDGYPKTGIAKYGYPYAGIGELERPAILLFPNPTSAELHVNTGDANGIEILELYQSNGMCSRRITLESDENTIDVSLEPKGQYVFRILRGGLVVASGSLILQ